MASKRPLASPSRQTTPPKLRARRISAKSTLAANLIERERCCRGNRALKSCSHAKSFFGLKLAAEFDTHDEKAVERKLPFLRK
eukprot:SAG11_NODE_19447_length_466_cov_1.114441_1_plen_82_part_10